MSIALLGFLPSDPAVSMLGITRTANLMAIADDREKRVHSERAQYLDPFGSFDPFRLDLSEPGKLIEYRYRREVCLPRLIQPLFSSPYGPEGLLLSSIKLLQRAPHVGGFQLEPKIGASSISRNMTMPSTWQCVGNE